MKYTFKCSECAHTEAITIHMEQRNDTLPCPACAKESFARDVQLTLAAAGKTTPYHEDILSYMERHFSQDVNFRPPTSKGPEGRSRAGAGRHFDGDPRYRRRWQ